MADKVHHSSSSSSQDPLSDNMSDKTMEPSRVLSEMDASSTLASQPSLNSRQPTPRRHFDFAMPQEEEDEQPGDKAKEVATYIVENIAPEKRAEAVKVVARALALRRLREQTRLKEEHERAREAEENDKLTISKSAFNIHMARIKAAQELSSSWIKDTEDSLDGESIQARIIDMSLEEIHDTAVAMERGKNPVV
ncbi:hypothetical protein CORC01_12575 [Colletotrichum orchidophilum]|uniref:Uncharacterized protein n=1 Tax=Colletotrichum orchidophilum TaxID=1209926 RepID=A0A1G4ASI2_9PEZI|nr:uncharacterized protein CORC01_12575 [Colletotrichum orchidophilum]OHE92120.1 hypothetical protein CORC01_12575 [Colletotrichum orchidophilum]